MSSRREARERAMQALYAFTIGGDDAQHVIDTIINEKLGDDKTAKQFAQKLFLITMDTAEEADRLVERHAQNWDLERIAWIDRLLLRMAISELLHFDCWWTFPNGKCPPWVIETTIFVEPAQSLEVVNAIGMKPVSVTSTSGGHLASRSMMDRKRG